jgi:hypothetical protein
VQRLEQEWERRLEVDAIGGENDVGLEIENLL